MCYLLIATLFFVLRYPTYMYVSHLEQKSATRPEQGSEPACTCTCTCGSTPKFPASAGPHTYVVTTYTVNCCPGYYHKSSSRTGGPTLTWSGQPFASPLPIPIPIPYCSNSGGLGRASRPLPFPSPTLYSGLVLHPIHRLFPNYAPHPITGYHSPPIDLF